MASGEPGSGELVTCDAWPEFFSSTEFSRAGKGFRQSPIRLKPQGDSELCLFGLADSFEFDADRS